MKKESIIVGIFGLSLGLLVAWAIWNFKSAAPQPKNLAVSPSPVVFTNPTPPPPPTSFLSLESPEDESLATESTLKVKGKTKPESVVVISTNLEDFVLTASQDGSFTQDVTLEEGENTVTVTSYNPNKEETLEKTVIYTKELL